MEEPVKQVETRDEHGRWNEGVSGNPQGRPRKGMAWKDVVVDIGEEELEKSGTTRKEYIVKTVFNKAASGDLDAIRLLWNSLVGNKTTNEFEGNGQPFELILKDYRGTNPTTETKRSV